MKPMRVARGTVVGNTIVLEGAVEPTPLAEGSHVTVYLDEEGWDVDEAAWRELDAAIAEADAGDVVSAESVLSELSALK